MAATLLKKLRRISNLRMAWAKVRGSALNSNSPSIRDEAEKFQQKLEKNLALINGHLKEGTYKFQPGKGIASKKKGKSPRPIVVGSIPDRITQRALLQVLQTQDHVKELYSNPNSFGGLHKRNVEKAIRKACWLINNGSKYYLKSDIAEFFTKIPRQMVIRKICDRLPDSSISDILDQATTVEISNIGVTKKHPGLFPTYELGVAQGFCLSPLFGNVLLHEFDHDLNREGVNCLRYVDDILILGPDKRCVRNAFRRAKAILKKLGMSAYESGFDKSKASEGESHKSFDFLGCRISKRTVTPNMKSQQRIIEKVNRILETNVKAIAQDDCNSDALYRNSLSETLSEVSRTLRGWGNHYSFCNCDPAFKKLDDKVDNLVSAYLGRFKANRSKLSPENSKRALGIRLLVDSKHSPIYNYKTDSQRKE